MGVVAANAASHTRPDEVLAHIEFDESWYRSLEHRLDYVGGDHRLTDHRFPTTLDPRHDRVTESSYDEIGRAHV